MAIDRETYRRRIGGVGIPDIQFSQYPAMAETFSELNKRIDVVKQYALEKGTEEAIQRGKAYGVANPINIADFLNADAVTREKFLSSGPTAFDKAADAVRINLLTTDIETATTTELNSLLTTAKESIGTPNEPSPETLAALLYGIVDGATEALEGDPDAAITLYSSLATKANAGYKTYLDELEASALYELQASTLARAEETINSIGDFVGQDTVMDMGLLSDWGIEDEADSILKWEDQVSFIKQAEINKMESADITPGKIETFVRNFNKRVSEVAQQKYYTGYISTQKYWDSNKSDVENVVEISKNHESRVFPNDSAKRLYNSVIDKIALDKRVNEWRNGVIDRYNDEEDIVNNAIADDKEKLNYDFSIAEKNDNVEEMARILQVVEDKGSPYVDLLDDFTARSGALTPISEGSDTINFTTLQRGLYDRDIGLDEIREASGRYITTGRGQGGQKSEETILTELFFRLRDEDVIAAENVLRKNLGMPGIDPRTGNLVSEAQLQVLKATGKLDLLQAQLSSALMELDEWVSDNPQATGKEIKAYAKTLLVNQDAKQVQKNLLDFKAVQINDTPKYIPLTNLDSFNRLIRENLEASATLTDDQKFYTNNWLRWAERNPDLFEDYIVKPLEKEYFRIGGSPAMPNFPNQSEELYNLLLLMKEYNSILEERPMEDIGTGNPNIQ